eukprot:1161710-Pelagomonas_calceolata.AAC.6
MKERFGQKRIMKDGKTEGKLVDHGGREDVSFAHAAQLRTVPIMAFKFRQVVNESGLQRMPST